MSRKSNDDQIAFGSDSFLDIIANIVGILIILIVVAGVRVSQAPVIVAAQNEQAAAAALPSPAVVEESEGPAVRELAAPDDASFAAIPEELPAPIEPAPPAAAVVVEPQLPAVPPQVLPPPPSPELLAAAAGLQAELATLSGRSERLTDEMKQMSEDRQNVAQRLAQAAAAEQEQRLALVQEAARTTALKSDLERLRGAHLNRQAALREAQRAAPPVREIRHRLTPISRAVEGREIHFQLLGGRIAYVPVDELVEQLKSRLSRDKDWLARVSRHEGVIGPLGGFSMSYLVERQSMSILDELRQGSGLVRIAVTEWRIIPGDDYVSEAAAEALAPGSAFIRRLQATDLDTALTLWVYPDSFALFRTVQEFAHAEGFVVAARPLPAGIPIAASPQGTRSAAQ